MNYEKVSPALAATLDDFEAAGPPALVAHDELLGLVSVGPAATTTKPARVVVFLHVDEGVAADRWAELGVELNQGSGPVRTGIVPLTSLGALTDDPMVQRVVPAERVDLCMDIAADKVHVPRFRASSGLTGNGVVVGVVDTGINSAHPAFAGRVLRIWDQTLPGPGVPEGGYGAELTGSLLTVSQDQVGHGTHVAGIAAADDDPFSGVAPGADLVVVKTDLMTAHIADGVRYVFRVAREMRRPAVVNLSLGAHGDAHDGTDSLSQIIDGEVGPGRIVCCAAGNEGDFNIHAQVIVPQSRTRTVSCSIPPPPEGRPPRVTAVNGWYPGGDRLEVAVVGPSRVSTPWQPVIAAGSPSRTYAIADGSVRITTPGPDPSNGDHNFFIQILPSPPENAPRRDRWQVRLRGDQVADGKVDLWILKQPSLFTGRYVKDSMKIGSPGACSTAVTVASYTTRNRWTNILGQDFESGLDLDDISDFSSEGPRRDGAEKPDVAAPGSMIVSAMSAHAGFPQPLIIDPFHTAMDGTSMACPFVAGLVALLLERDPTLGPDDAKALLRAESAIPGKPGGTFDPKWGYGLVDADGL
jgi:subtilisin family serine protease